MNIKKGLTKEEVKERSKKYGNNEIKRKKKTNPIKLFLLQFTSPLIILLIVAALFSFSVDFFRHENYSESILIIIIVFASGIAGFVQDYKAEMAIELLQKMATPKAKVIRDGEEREIESIYIVPGDLIIVEGGDIVPADSKIIDGNLEIDESILTGESGARKKKAKDNIFSNCGVYNGIGIAEVFAIGMETQVGKIASKMQEINETETTFQSHMKKFTKNIVGLTSLVIIITFFIGFPKFGFLESCLIAVSLAVAAIPEGLPAAITIALSLGAKNMVKKNALVRRLITTESIGSVDIICTDKTGTLTQGKMEVGNIWMIKNSEKAKEMIMKCCYYCNNAKQIFKDKEKKWVGDETDIALKQFSLSSVNEQGKRIHEIPFSSDRKMMTVVQYSDKKNIFSKGAPETIIKKCNRCLVDKKVIKLSEKLKKNILEENKKLASKGYRILSMAYKDYKKPIEKNLIFIGFTIISDQARPEVKKAVSECYSAGIRTIMITGDNPLTANAIANDVGINTKGVFTGNDIDNMDENELKRSLKKDINIFARTNPFHKLRILKVLQKDNHVVAMTGDGVNDALALKKADVGISMGIKGTEVAKEASDIVLLDDNFETIKDSIKEGRKIFDNIRKFVNYLFTCNIAEVIVVLFATIFMPYPILFPIQILWINLITDCFPALALSADPATPNIMKKKPRKKSENIINKKLGALVGFVGIKKAFVLLGTFFVVLPLGIDKARTTLFTGFIIYEFVRIGVIRYNEKLASFKDWFANKFLIYSLLLSFGLQLLVIYTPLSAYFNIVSIGLYEWIVLIIGTVVGFTLGILISWIIDKTIKE